MSKRVAVVPGTAFGECGEGYIRVSYCYSIDNIKKAIDRIEEFINELKLDKDKMYEIKLIGIRNFEINIRDIFKFITVYNVLKIKDSTNIEYNLNEIKEENTLKGLFVKEALKKLESNEYSKEEIEKAIEIGFEALD